MVATDQCPEIKKAFKIGLVQDEVVVAQFYKNLDSLRDLRNVKSHNTGEKKKFVAGKLQDHAEEMLFLLDAVKPDFYEVSKSDRKTLMNYDSLACLLLAKEKFFDTQKIIIDAPNKNKFDDKDDIFQ